MSAAAEAAVAILRTLVEAWIEAGKDPKVEARRLVSAQQAKARAEARGAVALAKRPKR